MTLAPVMVNAGMATEWEKMVRVLERAELFWVTTVRSDGRPQTSHRFGVT
jgi:hypothetical protein